MTIRNQIMQAKDLPTKKLEVPEWGCTVHLKSWTLKDRTHLEASEGNGWQVQVLIKSLCDEQGQPVLNDADAVWLQDKSSAVVSRIVTECVSHNSPPKQT